MFNIKNKKHIAKLFKIAYLFLIVGLVLTTSIIAPTAARFKNRNTLLDSIEWDGTTASNFHGGTGTELDPYLIETPEELAYLSSQLLSDPYTDKYFELTKDIILNDGTFAYDDTNGITYNLSGTTYYVNATTHKYYDNALRTGTEIGTLNTLPALDGFEGNFDGKAYSISGFYISDSSSKEVALFTDLSGDITNLYLTNVMVFGGTNTAALASLATNANITNIMIDGYVIGKDTNLTQTVNITPTSNVINMQNSETTNYIDASNQVPFEGAEIISTKITGEYTISDQTGATNFIKINGTTISGGTFDVDLGTTILEDIPVNTYIDLLEGADLTFTNLDYEVTYNYGVTASVVAVANDVTIENIVNKATLYGYSASGGIVGVTTNSLSINQTYNEGNTESDYISGGIIGVIEKSSNNISVLKSYNTSLQTAPDYGGLIGYIKDNTGITLISDSFNTSTNNYSIGTISNSSVTVTNTYYVNGTTQIETGSATGTFTSATLANLQTKSWVDTNLIYDEFISFTDVATNTDNVWIFEDNELPILFIDDIENPVANINISNYSWNNLSYNLSRHNFATTLNFEIEDLGTVSEAYYYIEESSDPLTSTEINNISSWNTYSSAVSISTEGEYIVYAKIVDTNTDTWYLNTDVIVLDLSDPTVTITYDTTNWTDLRSSLNDVYINQDKTLTITASDTLSGVDKIEYYISDQILNETELDAISSWTEYNTSVTLDSVGDHIVYAKITDNTNHVTYGNSDKFIYDGYTEGTLIIGRNSTSYPAVDPYITNKSTITFNLTYLDNAATELTSHTHNLATNILLPQYTKITLLDNINEMAYIYTVPTADDNYGFGTNGYATYPFTSFKEIGTGTTNKNYTESTYYTAGTTAEDFTIIIDLEETTITTNYDNVNAYINLEDGSNNIVRPTLLETYQDINIYYEVNSEAPSANLDLSTTYTTGDIIWNSSSSTDFNITSKVTKYNYNNIDYTDTTFEDKKMGLSIKMVDDQNQIIDRNYLKNITFKVGETIYYPEADHITRIDWGSALNEVTKDLTIETYENIDDLEEGSYFFKISNFTSFDDKHYNSLSSNEISIPIDVQDTKNPITHGFSVTMDQEDKIISKEDQTVLVNFNILESGQLETPEIKVSLYEKDLQTAFDQNYTQVDLASYVSDVLTLEDTNLYLVTNSSITYEAPNYLYNTFELNLNPANFNNNGYKYVFDLYDGERLITSIEKYFIVK